MDFFEGGFKICPGAFKVDVILVEAVLWWHCKLLLFSSVGIYEDETCYEVRGGEFMFSEVELSICAVGERLTLRGALILGRWFRPSAAMMFQPQHRPTAKLKSYGGLRVSLKARAAVRSNGAVAERRNVITEVDKERLRGRIRMGWRCCSSLAVFEVGEVHKTTNAACLRHHVIWRRGRTGRNAGRRLGLTEWKVRVEHFLSTTCSNTPQSNHVINTIITPATTPLCNKDSFTIFLPKYTNTTSVCLLIATTNDTTPMQAHRTITSPTSLLNIEIVSRRKHYSLS
jgi:hypothetical protein